MNRPAVRRPSTGVVVAAALVVISTVLGAASTTAAASTTVASDPLGSVTYQENPGHDGSYVDSTFVAPLQQSWSTDLGGTVSYPVIADGRVFVTFADAYGPGDLVEAFSLTTGQVLWGPKAIAGTFPSGMLAYDRGRVFAVNSDGRMSALDAATGVQQWVTQLPDESDFTSPPTAVDGTVYVGGFGSDGFVYAVDEATGDLSWAAPVLGGSSSSPAVGDAGVFVSYSCDQTYRFDLDGTLAWHGSSDCVGGGGRTSVLHDGKLFVRDEIKSPEILNAATGTLLGSFISDRAPAFGDTSMATISRGVLAVWDTESGDRLWEAPTTDNATAPLVANGYVVEGRENGTVELRRLEDGALVSSVSAGDEILPTDEHNFTKVVGLAVGDGALAVPAGSRLSVFFPTGSPRVTITRGPGQHRKVGPDVRFRFTSNVLKPTYTCTLDRRPKPCTSPVRYPQLSGGVHTFSVAVTGSAISSATRVFQVDGVAPSVRLARFNPLLTRHATVISHWSGSDLSHVRAYQLRVRRAERGSPLPAWHRRTPTRATHSRLHVPIDGRLCVSLRAEDGVGNWSGWTAAQCVVRRPRHR